MGKRRICSLFVVSDAIYARESRDYMSKHVFASASMHVHNKHPSVMFAGILTAVMRPSILYENTKMLSVGIRGLRYIAFIEIHLRASNSC